MTNPNPFMSNPHQSPDPSAAPTKKTRKKHGMMDVITGQKLVIYSMIAYLCALPFFAVFNLLLRRTPEAPVTPLLVVVLAIGFLISLASVIGAAIGILRMGAVLFPSARYLYAIGVLLPVPGFGLLVMITASICATTYLKERGVTVGFFGAKR